MLRPIKIFVSLLFLPRIFVQCFLRPLSQGKSIHRTVLFVDKGEVPFYISPLEEEVEVESSSTPAVINEGFETNTVQISSDTSNDEQIDEYELGILTSTLETGFAAVSDTIMDEIVKPLLGTKIERQVPSEVIQGAFISGALVSLLAGQGIISSVTGLAALSSAYLAITPGKGGDAARGLGGLTYKSANLMANLYSQLLPFLQLASQNQNTLTGIGKEQRKNRLIELEKLETEMNSVLAEVELAVTKAEADLSKKDATTLGTEDKEENQDSDQIQNASLSSTVDDEPEIIDNTSSNVMVETNMNSSEAGNLTVQDINQAAADEILSSVTEYDVKDVDEETSEEQMDKTVIDNVVHSQSMMNQDVNREGTLSSLSFEETTTIGILDDTIPGETFQKSVDLNEELKTLATKNLTTDEAETVSPELIVIDGVKPQILEAVDNKDEDTNNLVVLDSTGAEMFESYESIDIDLMNKNTAQSILGGEGPDVLQKDNILNQDVESQNVETNVREPISVEMNTQESDDLAMNSLIDSEVTNSIPDQVAIDVVESEAVENNDVWESELAESFALMGGDLMDETIEKDVMDIKEPEAIENNNLLTDMILNENIDVGVVRLLKSEEGEQDPILNEVIIGSLNQVLPDIEDPEKFQSSSSLDEGNVENADKGLPSVNLIESLEEQPVETGNIQKKSTKRKVITKTKPLQENVSSVSEIMSGLSEMPTIDEGDDIKDLESSENTSLIVDVKNDEILDFVPESGGVINSLNLSPDQEEISTNTMDTNVVSDPVSINTQQEEYDSIEDSSDTYEMVKEADILSLQQQSLISKEEAPLITEVTKKRNRSAKRKTKGDSLANEPMSEESLIEAKQKPSSKSKKSYTRKDKVEIVELLSKVFEIEDESLDLAAPKKDDDQELKTELISFVAAGDTDTNTLVKNEESERASSIGEKLYPKSDDGIILDLGNQPAQPVEQDFSPIDDNDVLNMSPEELAAQAKLARIAVELFESQRYEDSGSGMLTDENGKGEWTVESKVEDSVTLQKEQINSRSSLPVELLTDIESAQENVNDSIIRPVAFMSGKMQAFNINGDLRGSVLELGQEMNGELEEVVSKIQKNESVEERITFVSQLPQEDLTKAKKTVRKKKQPDAKKSGKNRSSSDSSEDLSFPMSYAQKSKDGQTMASTPLSVKQTSDLELNNEASEIRIRSDEKPVGRWNDAIAGNINAADEREQETDWIPSPFDQNDDLDMTPEELAAQARAARLAVEIFESQRVQEVDFRDTLDRPEKYDWNLEFDDDEPSDQDLLEIDSEMSSEIFGEINDILSINSKSFINTDVDDASHDMNAVGLHNYNSPNWTTMKVADLRKELRNRGVKATGTKAMLIAALEKAQSDDSQGQVTNDDYLDDSEEWGTINKLELNAGQVSSDIIQKHDPTPEELSSSFEAMTIAELRRELKLRGLKTTGKKLELVKRLMAIEKSFD